MAQWQKEPFINYPALMQCNVTADDISSIYITSRDGLPSDKEKRKQILKVLEVRPTPTKRTDLSEQNVNLKNNQGYTVLHYACLCDSERSVKKFLKLGASVNIKEQNGNQPLHLAVKYSRTEVVRCLLDHAASIFEKNNDNKNPLQLALLYSRYKRSEILVVLLEHLQAKPDYQPCYVDIHDNSKEWQDCIINLHSSFRLADNMEMPKKIPDTMLSLWLEASLGMITHWGYYGDNIDVLTLKSLFQRIENLSETSQEIWIANIEEYKNSRNKYGNTLLHYSCSYNYPWITNVLLNLGIDIVPNKQGDTALHVACSSGALVSVKLLLKAGAKIYLNNKEAYSPLSCAVKERHNDLVGFLLESGVKPDGTYHQLCKRPESPVTAKEMAHLPVNVAAQVNPGMIPVLLNYGASLNFSTEDNLDILNTSPQLIIMEEIGSLKAQVWERSSYRLDQKIERYTKAFCYLLSAGAKFIKNHTFRKTLQTFESGYLNAPDKELLLFMKASGFKLSRVLTELLEQNHQPKNLTSMCTETIRTNLFPNAWVGVKRLGLPESLKRIITMKQLCDKLVKQIDLS